MRFFPSIGWNHICKSWAKLFVYKADSHRSLRSTSPCVSFTRVPFAMPRLRHTSQLYRVAAISYQNVFISRWSTNGQQMERSASVGAFCCYHISARAPLTAPARFEMNTWWLTVWSACGGSEASAENRLKHCYFKLEFGKRHYFKLQHIYLFNCFEWQFVVEMYLGGIPLLTECSWANAPLEHRMLILIVCSEKSVRRKLCLNPAP